MAILAIIRRPDAINNDSLGTRIAKKFPGNFYRLAKGQWLVASDLDPQSLSAELGVVAGAHYGGTLVFEVGEYFGLHDRKLWDWIKDKRD